MNFKFKNLFVKGIKKNKNAPIKAKQKRTIFTRVRIRSHSINRTGGPAQQPSTARTNINLTKKRDKGREQRTQKQNYVYDRNCYMAEQASQLWVKVYLITAQEIRIQLQKSRSEQDMVRGDNPVTLAAERAVVSSRASCMNTEFKYSLYCVKPCSKNKTEVDFIETSRVQRRGDTTVGNLFAQQVGIPGSHVKSWSRQNRPVTLGLQLASKVKSINSRFSKRPHLKIMRRKSD